MSYYLSLSTACQW